MAPFPTGQLLLKGTSVLIVGVGGLGCPLATYLAAAGIGELPTLWLLVIEEEPSYTPRANIEFGGALGICPSCVHCLQPFLSLFYSLPPQKYIRHCCGNFVAIS